MHIQFNMDLHPYHHPHMVRGWVVTRVLSNVRVTVILYSDLGVLFTVIPE